MKWEKISVTWILAVVLLLLVTIGVRQVVLFRQQAEMEKFKALTLIPNSAVGVLQSDNFLELASHCPPSFALKGAEKLPSYYYQYFNKVVVSEHIEQGKVHFVTYIKCIKSSQKKLIDAIRLVNKSHYPTKTHHYSGKTIRVLPREGGDFLAIYATDKALILSEDLYLLYEVIDTEYGRATPLVNSEGFNRAVRVAERTRHKVFFLSENVWTNYEMSFNETNIYFTTNLSSTEGERPFLNMLATQTQIEEWAGDMLSEGVVDLQCFSTSNLSAWMPYIDFPDSELWLSWLEQRSKGQMLHVTYGQNESIEDLYLIPMKQEEANKHSEMVRMLSEIHTKPWGVVDYNGWLILCKSEETTQAYIKTLKEGRTMDKSVSFRHMIGQFEPPFSLFGILCHQLPDTERTLVEKLGFKELIQAYPTFYKRFCVGVQVSHANESHYVNVVFVPK